MTGRMMIVAAVLMALPGCVAKSDYAAKVAELEGVQREKAALEEKQKGTERTLADEQQKTSDLSTKIAELEKARAVLEKERTALQQENTNIKSTLEMKRDQLSREVVDLKNRVTENSSRIAALDQELAAKNKHILELREMIDHVTREKQTALEEKERAIANVTSTYDRLVSELKQEIKQGEIHITQLKDRLTVNMVDKILFDSGSAVIKRNGKKVLDRVAEILKNVKGQQIKIEGHTDNVPIGAGLVDRFPTNWELATARATTVVRYLQEQGVHPGLLSAEGYGEYRPVAPNDNEENRAKNRRIEIVLIPMDAKKPAN